MKIIIQSTLLLVIAVLITFVGYLSMTASSLFGGTVGFIIVVWGATIIGGLGACYINFCTGIGKKKVRLK